MSKDWEAVPSAAGPAQHVLFGRACGPARSPALWQGANGTPTPYRTTVAHHLQGMRHNVSIHDPPKGRNETGGWRSTGLPDTLVVPRNRRAQTRGGCHVNQRRGRREKSGDRAWLVSLLPLIMAIPCMASNGSSEFYVSRQSTSARPRSRGSVPS